jgi:AcrR family transcriptional regulator
MLAQIFERNATGLFAPVCDLKSVILNRAVRGPFAPCHSARPPPCRSEPVRPPLANGPEQGEEPVLNEVKEAQGKLREEPRPVGRLLTSDFRLLPSPSGENRRAISRLRRLHLARSGAPGKHLPQRPYRHFRDKEELLAAVAAEGFDRLTESMTRAAGSGSGALDRLRLSGRGYVEFALRHPQHFAVMFDVPRRFDSYPETRAAGERALGTLVRYVEDCQAEGSLPKGDWKPLALLAWSIVHGVAKLALGGRLPFSKTAQVLQFTDIATEALRLGMANLPNSGLRFGRLQ